MVTKYKESLRNCNSQEEPSMIRQLNILGYSTWNIETNKKKGDQIFKNLK